MTARRCLLARRPVGLPTREDFTVDEADPGDPGDGQVLVEVTHVSIDPAMRGWMNDVRSYIPPVGLGEVMRAGAIGRVLASRADGLEPGAHVSGAFGVQTHALADANAIFPVDTDLAPPARHLGVLGMPGMTAYFGLLEVGALRDGETVVVSGAAGAVGSVVGQIAGLRGCRVIGIAGGADKCAWVRDELGFDDCIDYKAGDVAARLREAAPDRVDVYFDNVGGEILDAVLTRLARGARVVICGAISQYNATEAVQGPRNYLSLLVQRARMEGFVVFDYASRYRDAARELAGWVADGRLHAREDVVRGTVEDFPDVLARLFRGENVGKLVLQLAD